MDRGYTNFLTHLHVGTSTISLPTIQATLSHYLANASPLPTPLAGTVVSSPLFLALSYQKLQALSSAFRYAFHVKYKLIETELEERRSQRLGWGTLANLISQSFSTRLKQWASATLKGLHGGHPILRLACCSGMLIGMEDLRIATRSEGGHQISFEGSWVKGDIEDEIVVALAESIDRYSYLQGDAGWEREFRKIVDPIEVDAISLSLVLMSQCSPFIPLDKLSAIPLQTLSRLLSSSLEAAFFSGTFIDELSSSLFVTSVGPVSVSSVLSDGISSLASSPLFLNIGPISKLAARVVSALFNSSRQNEGLLVADMTLTMLMGIAARVELAWSRSPLPGLKEDALTPQLQALSKDIWTVFKTLLFAAVMIAKECLSQAVYVSPQALSAGASPRPADLGLLTLRTLCNLSFVVHEFGGVASLTSVDPEGGFKELKETFYSALDILTGQPVDAILPNDGFNQVEQWAREVCTKIRAELPHEATDSDANVGLEKYSILASAVCLRAKTAFVLASVEQLVVCLSDDALKEWVLPVCLPILEKDDEHREAYESAHSVILAIFSSRAQAVPTQGSADPTSLPTTGAPRRISTGITADIAVKLVPFYTSCLIESSRRSKLTTQQLCLAFSTMVKCTSAKATILEGPTRAAGREALTWYCIEALLSAIRGMGEEYIWPTHIDGYDEHSHRLHLMLISSISCTSLSLLPRVLDEVRSVLVRNGEPFYDAGITSSPSPKRVERHNELIKVLVAEIVEGVGDREKDVVMRWWHDNRFKMAGGFDPRVGVEDDREEKLKNLGGAVSRL